MKLPERNDSYLISTCTISGSIVLAGVVFGTISAHWLWIAVPLLFMGHSHEYKKLWLMPK
jgi:hypothetical protein|tara:strand:- start:1220 stop:1399 length:180 start_codon:yes stop_codon:yes gene_type:complete